MKKRTVWAVFEWESINVNFPILSTVSSAFSTKEAAMKACEEKLRECLSRQEKRDFSVKALDLWEK